MDNLIHKYCNIVRNSSNDNDKSIHILFENRLYKNTLGILREELELYVKTLYLLNQDEETRDHLLDLFINNQRWQNKSGKVLTDREMLNFASRITGLGWEQISYKFSCCFIHLSILLNWEEDDVTSFINIEERRIIVDYINKYHGANLTINSSFEDIVLYSLKIFEKIKDNLECYLIELETINRCV